MLGIIFSVGHNIGWGIMIKRGRGKEGEELFLKIFKIEERIKKKCALRGIT